MSSGTQTEDYEALLAAYLQLCNRALIVNRDRFPYNQIWQAAEEAMAGRSVELAVVDETPKVRCQVTMKDHLLASTPQQPSGSAQIYRITAEQIRRTLANADQVVSDPSLIDWGWALPPAKPAVKA